MRATLFTTVLLFSASLSALSIHAATTQPVETATTQPGAASDLSTPLAAVITYFHAVDIGDIATAKVASIHDARNEKFIEALIAEQAAQRKYRDAAVKRFGANEWLSDLGSSNMVIRLAKQEPVHENGDVADIGDSGDFPCKKVDGKWRLDLLRQNADVKRLDQTIAYCTKSAQLYNDFASQVPTGNWKTLDELETARSAAAPEPPAPPDPK